MEAETVGQVLPTVKIEPGFGQSTIILDGQDVSNLLSRVTVDLAPKQAPQVFLELATTVLPEAIECQAVVRIVQIVAEEPAKAMLKFLENIDADELDRCILESMGGLGEAQTYGTVCLDVLRGWANGD
jgi:hypothetical protein